MADFDVNLPTLGEIFDDIWKIYEFLETTDEPTVSDKVQKEVIRGIREAEKAVHMVNELALFSNNEDVEEVPTNEIRLMLLSALLAYFTVKNTQAERFDSVKKAQVFYTDYLQLVKQYGVTQVDVPELHDGQDEQKEQQQQQQQRVPRLPQDTAVLVSQRQGKIERYKQQKETDSRLLELHQYVMKDHVDDEVKREYYMTLLKKWVNSSLEDLESIQSELPILEHMAKVKAGGGELQHSPSADHKPAKKMRPFILTKTDLQKKVFGAGYSSLPTYTVEEFFEQRYQQEGGLPQPGGAGAAGGSLQAGPDAESRERDAVDKEQQIESDDPEALKKARDWDDWTDDHRRGWGNTQNKG